MLKVLDMIYRKKYKHLLIIPILILLLSAGVLLLNNHKTGEFIDKDISLKGGTLVTVQTVQDIDISGTEDKLGEELGASVRVKEIRGVASGGRIGYTFESGTTGDIDTLKKSIEESSGILLVEGQYTIEEMSSSLSSTFWNSTIKALILAFIFMAGVVFFYFRKLVPSLAITLAAVSNLIGVLALMNILSIRLSTAGVAALLMLLGYSVDTNILLSTKLLKRKDLELTERLYSALKTGLTMAVTTITALLVVWILSPASVLRQISLILIFGLMLDMINTWVMNSSLLRIWLKRREG